MLEENLYWYSNIYGYQCPLNEKNVIFCLIMWKINWVSCPKRWVSWPKPLVSLGEFGWVDQFLFGWVGFWVSCPDRMSDSSPKNQLTQKPTHPSCDQLTQVIWSTHPNFESTHPSFGTTHPSFKTYGMTFRNLFLSKICIWIYHN